MKIVIIINAKVLGYQVIRALGEKGLRCIVLYDEEKYEIGRYSRYVTKSYKLPAFNEHPDQLADFLISRQQEWAGYLLIPTNDFGAEFLAEYQQVLSPSYLVPTPAKAVIEQIMNKVMLYKIASKAGIQVPAIYTPQSLQELEEIKQKIRYPCLLKPGLGHIFFKEFDCKMLEIQDYDELKNNYLRLTDHFSSDRYKMMISEIIPGHDHENMLQYSSYLSRSGNVLAAVTCKKIRQDPPNYGQSRVAVTLRNNELENQSINLLKKLGYSGFSEIEWKYDAENQAFKLIEINTRFIFYTGLLTKCGINFPYLQFQEFVNKTEETVTDYQEDIYWIHLYKDVLHTLLHRSREKFTFSQYIRPYFHKKTFAVFSIKDPIPFLFQWSRHTSNMLKKLIRK